MSRSVGPLIIKIEKAFTGYRICFVAGHLKYKNVRLHTRRLASTAPRKRLPCKGSELSKRFNPVNRYKIDKNQGDGEKYEYFQSEKDFVPHRFQ